MAGLNWVTKSIKIQKSGQSVQVRVDAPDTAIVVSVEAGSLSATVPSTVDGTLLENLTLSAPAGISILQPTVVFGNAITVTAAADNTEVSILKLT